MRTTIGNTKVAPDETVFPQLRKGKFSNNVYLFMTKTFFTSLTKQDKCASQDDQFFDRTDYFTGSITLSND